MDGILTLRIAIVVHGRFHAFDLARALLRRGHEVVLFTNYPAWAVVRFDLPRECVRSFWFHGFLSRVFARLPLWMKTPWLEESLYRLFGSWAAAQLRKGSWDLVNCWSGASEELLRDPQLDAKVKLLVRGSSHMRTQEAIAIGERKRTGFPVELPAPWMIAREEREYGLAPWIRVPSRFARDSFIQQGVPASKVVTIPSSVPLETFRSRPGVVEERVLRIRSGEPLRVLYAGSLSFRKGLWDLQQILEGLEASRFSVRVVGSVAPEAVPFLAERALRAEKIPHQPQEKLPELYAWADLFLFPTLEDGYPQTLAQAYASGLVALATNRCSAPDFIRDGETGWVLPPADPKVFLERLRWCDAHREETAAMVQRIQKQPLRDWDKAAQELETFAAQAAQGTHVRFSG